MVSGSMLVVQVVLPGAGGLHEVHRQLQLLGDIYRQRHLNLSRVVWMLVASSS